MTDTALVTLTPAQATTARANGFTVYSTTVNGVALELALPSAIVVTPPPPPPTQTFTATQVGTSQIQVAWAGFSPVKIGRNGVDSNGTGPWSTATLTGEPSTGTFTFNSLVPGNSYILTATKADGTAITTAITMSGGVVVTPPPVTPPPNSGTYPLGIDPYPLGVGESVIKLFDFKSGLNTTDFGVYSGKSQPSNGQFVTINTTVVGGELNLKMNQNPSLGTPVNNNEVGAGVQLISHTMQPGQRIEFAFKNVPMNGAYQIGLLFAADNVWPGHGEIDILEQDDGGAFKSTVISNAGNPQKAVPTTNASAHMMALAWTTDGHLRFYLDNLTTPYWDFPTPPAPFGAAGLNFCLQTQQESIFNSPGLTSDEIVDWVRLVKLA